MPISYTLHARASVLPQRELVLLFWGKGALPVQGNTERRIRRHLTRVGATGEEQEMQLFPFPYGSHARTLVLIGLGKKTTLDTFRRGVALATQQARQMAIREIAVIAPEDLRDVQSLGAACVEGAALGGYAFTRYHEELAKRERTRSLRRLELFCDRNAARDVRAGIRLGEIFSRATIAARDLVNEPSSHVTPAALADTARQIARDSHGVVRARILDRAACHEAGMGAFLAVAQGSVHPPFFIHLTYTPAHSPNTGSVKHPVVALIGKGITFDSGGLSLKPAEGMETMKIDMAGAASVYGVVSV